ncbi:MAG: hypothetical protein K6L75_08200 [Cellvibrionaceae bacterium]
MCKFLLAIRNITSTNNIQKKPRHYHLNFGFVVALLFSSLAFCNTASSSSIINHDEKDKMITSNYQYSGKHGLDFSSISRGPIQLNAFTDERKLGGSEKKENKIHTFIFSKEIASIIQKGIEQAFLTGAADIVPSDGNLKLSGIVETAEITAEKFVLRVKLSLSNKGKNVWNNTLFSKVSINDIAESGIDNKNINKALNDSIDKLIEELFFDDYFLLEVLD